LPVERRSILWAKVRVAAEHQVHWAVVAIFGVAVAFGFDFGWLAGLSAAAFVTSGVGAMAGLGAWLTIRCRTEVRAFRFLVPAVVAAIGTPVVVWNTTDWFHDVQAAGPLAIGAVICAVVGLFAWRRAVCDFERLG
jgi:hypothetical protein